MNITFPSNTKEVIDSIRGAIGRDVTFIYPVGITGCWVCSLDPVNNTSTDSFCPTCSGNYWINIYQPVTVTGHITWKPMDQLGWETGGQMFLGDCVAQIEYTEQMREIADTSRIVIVDSKEMYVDRRIFRGVPEINRIVLELKERTKDDE